MYDFKEEDEGVESASGRFASRFKKRRERCTSQFNFMKACKFYGLGVTSWTWFKGFFVLFYLTSWI